MTWLDHDLTTLALCWRVERRDGVAIGLTSHDRDLVVDGVTYRAAPGMTPSAVQRGDGFDAATMDVAGALTGAAAARMVQLPPGVDEKTFHPGSGGEEVRARLGLSDRPVVVCVSRLVARKGQDTLIRALPRVLAAEPETVLLIVGGALYSIGGVLYGLKWPNPWPTTFGHHEFFHACTAVAAICHYIAMWFAVFSS